MLFIKKAVELAQLGCIDGIVTAPINKEAINMAGCHFPGHTELLADLTKTQESGMMIVGGPLRIMFVTTHVAIKDLPALLTQAKIEKAIRLAHLALKDLFGIKKPRIGVAALNPHAGEHGLFGDEEAQVILPAARAAQAQGIRASDPLPAHTLFGKAARGDYDGVVALYHDQGLIPLACRLRHLREPDGGTADYSHLSRSRDGIRYRGEGHCRPWQPDRGDNTGRHVSQKTVRGLSGLSGSCVCR